MQPVNYCRQMKQAFQSMSTHPSIQGKTLGERMRHGIDLANASEKFLLPSGGRLIDDNEFRALDENLPLRLPYKFVALEFEAPKEFLDKDIERVNAFIVFAREDEESIAITPAFRHQADGLWGILPAYVMQKNDYLRRFEDALPAANGAFEDANFNPRAYRLPVMRLLGFLNCLACSNVSTQRLESHKGSKKVKSALPFDSYHVLTIDAAKKNERDMCISGAHRSPREHLRRGHIRRYENGTKIWVNAAVVNAGVGGKISKDYRLAA